MVWDDQKTEEYPYQTDFSYKANQIPREKWFLYNGIGGAILGLIMALIVFLPPVIIKEPYLTDLTRCLLAGVIGAWPLKVMETRSERTLQVAKLSMAIVFTIGIVAFAIYLKVSGA